MHKVLQINDTNYDLPIQNKLKGKVGILGRKLTYRILKVSVLMLLILGFNMLNPDLDLLDIHKAYALSAASTTDYVSTIAGNVQRITTRLNLGKYPSITVQKGIPLRWNMKAKTQDINICNGILMIPEYHIIKKLHTGDNIIEFKPEASGNIIYRCWMGMKKNNIKVIDDISKEVGK